MKKKELLIIGLFLVVCIEALFAGFKFIVKAAVNGGDKSFHTFSNKTLVEETVDLAEFEKLNIDVSSVNTYIEPGDSYKLEYCVYENNAPILDQDREKLSIKQPLNTGVFNINPSYLKNEEQYYKLTIPKNAGVINVDMEASSGKISIEDIDVEGKIFISSGEIVFENSSGDELFLHATSGEIDMKNTKVDRLKLDLTSGDLSARSCVTDSIDAKMTSGNMDIHDMIFNKADFEITSGCINLEVVGSEDDYAFDLKATSGEFNVNGTKAEKNYRTDRDTDKMITADITSGSLNVSFTK